MICRISYVSTIKYLFTERGILKVPRINLKVFREKTCMGSFKKPRKENVSELWAPNFLHVKSKGRPRMTHYDAPQFRGLNLPRILFLMFRPQMILKLPSMWPVYPARWRLRVNCSPTVLVRMEHPLIAQQTSALRWLGINILDRSILIFIYDIFFWDVPLGFRRFFRSPLNQFWPIMTHFEACKIQHILKFFIAFGDVELYKLQNESLLVKIG